MTRQLIIGSALIAAVAAPALAGTATNMVAGSTRATNPAAMAVPATNLARLHTASNPAELLKIHIPVDYVVRKSNPTEMFKALPDISIKASDAAGLFRASNPAVLFKKHDSTDWLRYVNPVVNRVRPLFVDDSLRRRICTACIPFVLRDPNLVSHHISGQNRVDLGGHTLLLRRIPAPGHAIGVELHIGDTTSVNGKIDNQ